MPPFVIFGLPRSRTAWLAGWLSAALGRPVGHDLAVTADSVDDWLGGLCGAYAGTIETGAVDAWRLVRRSLPAARLVVIRRPLDLVAASLARLGAWAPVGQLEGRAAALDELSMQPDVLTVQYDHLVVPHACALLLAHIAPGLRFDWELWHAWDRQNVQIDMPSRLALLAERAPQIAAMKAEATARWESGDPFVRVAAEPWANCADECRVLGASHHAEASHSIGPDGMEGVFALDVPTLAAMERNGLFRAFTARVNSRLAGYCLWTAEMNLEARGVSAAVQGPFYVAPGLAGLGLGARLLAVSRAAMAASGFRYARLHHTAFGRGARAGSLYRRLGAVETKREYTLALERAAQCQA